MNLSSLRLLIIGALPGCFFDSTPNCNTKTIEVQEGCEAEVSSCGDVYQECVSVVLIDGVCPSASDAGVSALCEEGQLSTDPPGGVGGGAPTGGMGPTGGAATGGTGPTGGAGGILGTGGAGATGGAVETGGSGSENELATCCYPMFEEYVVGRPFLVEGRPHVANHSPSLRGGNDTTVDPELAERVGNGWLEDALMEHASVAAFARFALELMALGAPLELVEASQRAMADELRHTRDCLAVARRFGVTTELGSLDAGVIDLRRPDLEDVVTRAIVEGCVGETVAAMIAAEAARASNDPEIKSILERITVDEASHAELAWRFVGWALEVQPSLRGHISAAFEKALSAPIGNGVDVGCPQLGRLSASDRAAVARATLREVVAPCAAVLLAWCGPTAHSLSSSA